MCNMQTNTLTNAEITTGRFSPPPRHEKGMDHRARAATAAPQTGLYEHAPLTHTHTRMLSCPNTHTHPYRATQLFGVLLVLFAFVVALLPNTCTK